MNEICTDEVTSKDNSETGETSLEEVNSEIEKINPEEFLQLNDDLAFVEKNLAFPV